MKRCARCGAEKTFDEFYTRKVRDKTYPTSYCKECHRKPPRFPESPEGYHYCSACKQHKPVGEFPRRTNHAGVKVPQRRCHGCRVPLSVAGVDRRRIRMHGITPESYEELLAAQGGVCAICREPETAAHQRTGKPRRLSIDHDHSCCPGSHSCGMCVRGLLCTGCNQGIGQLHDDPDRVEAAARYLRERRVRPAA